MEPSRKPPEEEPSSITGSTHEDGNFCKDAEKTQAWQKVVGKNWSELVVGVGRVIRRKSPSLPLPGEEAFEEKHHIEDHDPECKTSTGQDMKYVEQEHWTWTHVESTDKIKAKASKKVSSQHNLSNFAAKEQYKFFPSKNRAFDNSDLDKNLIKASTSIWGSRRFTVKEKATANDNREREQAKVDYEQGLVRNNMIIANKANKELRRALKLKENATDALNKAVDAESNRIGAHQMNLQEIEGQQAMEMEMASSSSSAVSGEAKSFQVSDEDRAKSLADKEQKAKAKNIANLEVIAAEEQYAIRNRKAVEEATRISGEIKDSAEIAEREKAKAKSYLQEVIRIADNEVLKINEEKTHASNKLEEFRQEQKNALGNAEESKIAAEKTKRAYTDAKIEQKREDNDNEIKLKPMDIQEQEANRIAEEKKQEAQVTKDKTEIDQKIRTTNKSE